MAFGTLDKVSSGFGCSKGGVRDDISHEVDGTQPELISSESWPIFDIDGVFSGDGGKLCWSAHLLTACDSTLASFVGPTL